MARENKAPVRGHGFQRPRLETIIKETIVKKVVKRHVRGSAGIFVAAIVALAGVPLAGCQTFPPPETVSAQHHINQALAGLSRGDYTLAETAVNKALAQRPSDPVALLAAGGVYQRTGRLQQAINAYRAAAAVPGDGVISGELWGVEGVAPLRSVARHALMSLNGGTPPVVSTMGPSVQARKGKPVDRLAILRSLRDQKLITPQEYADREGVKSPVSMSASEEDVADRLRQLAAAYATRNMSAEDYADQRQVILDRLVPRKPKTTLLAATKRDAAKTISEKNSKPGSVPKTVKKPKPAQQDKKSEDKKPAASGDGATPNPVAMVRSGREPLKIVPYTSPTSHTGDEAEPPAPVLPDATVAVHLASFRNHDAALRGWAQLASKFPRLARLDPQISTLTLPDKGTFFRLNAGPLSSLEEAKELCKTMKNQFCEPVFIGG